MNSELTEMKVCPFCGHVPILQVDKRWPGNSEEAVAAYSVICDTYNCPVYHADNTYFLTAEEAVEAWNTRV